MLLTLAHFAHTGTEMVATYRLAITRLAITRLAITRLTDRKTICLVVLLQAIAASAFAQQPQSKKGSVQKSREEEVRLGSVTAKGGFENEDGIRDKFRNWQSDLDARRWLEAMNYPIREIVEVTADKPHGKKADVVVRIKTKTTEHLEGISIKLVSNPQGFNQIDKRWLKTYAQMWHMPDDVHAALKLFVGELASVTPGRDARRMFLNELSESQQQAVVHFFKSNREKIVSDLFSGDGEHSAGWIMVTRKPIARSNASKGTQMIERKKSEDPLLGSTQPEENQQWVICSIEEAAAFFGDGEVQITPAGSLRIGRITMQRKGGDNGRDSANMLQFKINPSELFDR